MRFSRSLAALIVTAGLALSACTSASGGETATLHIVGFAVPGFLLALVVMYLAVAYFNVNVGGLLSTELINEPWSWAKVWDLLQHLPIPAIVLGLGGAAELMRVMRANLLDELPKPWTGCPR